jgi:hypothetical protein
MIKYLSIIFATVIVAFGAPKANILVDTNNFDVAPDGLNIRRAGIIGATNLYGGVYLSGSQTSRDITNLLSDAAIFAIGHGVIPGATDRADALQRAVNVASNLGVGVVLLPSGIIPISHDIVIPSGIKIAGQGRGITILTNTPTGSYTNGLLYFNGGSLTELPALNTSISKGSKTITFALNHGLVAGQFIRWQNTNEYSYSLARPYYKAGESAMVVSVPSSTTITINMPALTNYAVADTKLWLANYSVGNGVENLTVEMQQGTTVAGIQIELARDFYNRNAEVNGSRYAGWFFDRCYRGINVNIGAYDSQASVGNNYGGALSSCYYIGNYNTYMYGGRHGWSSGGGTSNAEHPNRYNFWQGGFSGTTLGDSLGFDLHGNSEYNLVQGMTIQGGHNIGGAFNYFEDNTIDNDSTITYFIGEGEQIGGVFGFKNNKYYARRNSSGFINLLGRWTVSQPLHYIFENNEIYMDQYTSLTYPSAPNYTILYGMNGGTNGPQNGFTNITIDIKNNKMFSAQTTNGPYYFAYMTAATTQNVAKVVIEDNYIEKGIVRTLSNSEEIQVNRNKFYSPLVDGWLHVTQTTPQNFVMIFGRDNYVVGAQRSGINMASLATKDYVQLERNTSINSGQGLGGTSQDTSLYITGSGNVRAYNNVFGDTNSSPKQLTTYYVNGATSLYVGRNRDIGGENNTLTPTLVATYLEEEEPSWGLVPDYVNQAYEMGTGASASYLNPIFIRRDTNGPVTIQWQNKQAAGNTSVGWFLNIQGGATGNSASGGIGAVADDYSTTRRRNSLFVFANSDATEGVTIDASEAGQKFNIYSGETSLSAQFWTNGLTLAERSTTGTPASGYGSFYPKTDNLPYFKNDAGTEIPLGLGYQTNIVGLALGDMSTTITTGAGKAYWIAPYDGAIVGVFGSVYNVSTSGALTFDINLNGSTIMAVTKLTVDQGENSSITAATPAVLTTTTFSAGQLITCDIDDAGANAAGAQINIAWKRR